MRRAYLVASAYSLAAMVAMFVVIGDTAAVTLSISSPTNGQTFVTDFITVNGTATDPGGLWEVFVLNAEYGGPVFWPLSGQSASFSVPITLVYANPPGLNSIFIQALNHTGNSSPQVRVDVIYNPPPPVIISSPKLTGTTFTLSVPTVVGSNYVLEFKNSLSDASWTDVQTNSGSGGVISLTNNGAIGPIRFYRVRVQ